MCGIEAKAQVAMTTQKHEKAHWRIIMCIINSSEQPGDLARALLKAKETNQHVEDANPYFKVKASCNSFANLKLLLEVDTHMSSPMLAQPQIANCSIEGNYGSGEWSAEYELASAVGRTWSLWGLIEFEAWCSEFGVGWAVSRLHTHCL